MKKFACGPAEQLNQGSGVRVFTRLGNSEKKLLEALIRSWGKTVVQGNERTTTRNAQGCVETGAIRFSIHKCLNLLGKYLSSQFESRKMGDRVPECEISRRNETFVSM